MKGIRHERPDDFAERAATTSTNKLVQRYGVGNQVIRRWRREVGIDSPTPNIGGKPKHAIPDDLEEQAKRLTHGGLERHYGVSNSTVGRWLRATGFKPQPYDNRAPKPGHHRAGCYHKLTVEQKRARSRALQTATRSMKAPPARIDSNEARAADFLRRHTPVFRCDEHGRMSERGTHWRYGNAILTGEEIQARARKHGWSPDAWAAVPSRSRPRAEVSL